MGGGMYEQRALKQQFAGYARVEVKRVQYLDQTWYVLKMKSESVCDLNELAMCKYKSFDSSVLILLRFFSSA